MSFGTRLKNLRQKNHVTQQELADYLNVTRPTIAGYETKGKEPNYTTLKQLAIYFHVSVDYLITGRNYPESLSEDAVSTPSTLTYEDFLILEPQIANATSTVIERIKHMDEDDVTRLVEYSKLLLYQPKYNKNH